MVGCTLRWTLPDSPETASFLTAQQKSVIERRLMQDAGTKAGHVNTRDGFSWHFLKESLLEWKIWLAVIIYWGNSICLYGFTLTAPTIILGLGYETWQAQLLTVPIYVLGAISTVFFSWLADRNQVRWPFIVGPYSIAICCFIALLAIPHPRYPGLTYAFLFGIPAGGTSIMRGPCQRSLLTAICSVPSFDHDPELGRQQPRTYMETGNRNGSAHQHWQSM